MRKPSHSTTQRPVPPQVPKWRRDLDGVVVDPAMLGLIDSLLHQGCVLSAQEFARDALQAAFATAPASYVDDRQASPTERQQLARARQFSRRPYRPQAICDVRGCGQLAAVFDRDQEFFFCDRHWEMEVGR